MSTQTAFIPSGATSVSVDVALVQSASGANPGNPITGLTYNTASLTCYYGGGTLTSTSVPLQTQTNTGAWSSGGFVARDATNQPGVYRFDVPNSLIPTTGEINFVFNGASGLATHMLKIIPTQQLFLGQFVESYAATTVVPNPAQAIQAILQILAGFNWSGQTLTVYKRNNATTALVCTANSSSNATGLTQTT